MSKNVVERIMRIWYNNDIKFIEVFARRTSMFRVLKAFFQRVLSLRMLLKNSVHCRKLRRTED